MNQKNFLGLITHLSRQRTGEDAHRRRLARTVGTEKSDHLTGLDSKAEVVDGDDVAVVFL